MGSTGRVLRAGLLVVAFALLSACELKTQVNVTVEDDGSGTVEVAVALDDETVTLRPDLLGDLEVDHLVDAGWEVTGPAPEDGFHWVRARHDFDSPDEVGPLVDQVAGESGPFRDFEITRSSDLTSESVQFRGTVDFSGLGESPVADDVTDAVEAGGDEVPAADLIEGLDEQFGAAIDEIVQVRIAVRLPGDVSSNAPTKASNGAVWQPSVVERGAIDLEATGTSTRTGTVVLIGIGIVVLVVLLLAGSVRLALWRRRSRA